MAAELSLRRSSLSLLLPVVIGAGWGVFCWWGDNASLTVLGLAANLGAPWLVIAFISGALVTRSLFGGAICGAITLLAAVVAYYASIEMLDPGPSLLVTERAARAWSMVAIPAGMLYGAAGGGWRRGGEVSPVAVALLGGASIGEGLFLIEDLRLYSYTSESMTYWAVAVGEIVAGLSVPVLLLRGRIHVAIAFALTVLLGVIGFGVQRALLAAVDDYLQAPWA